MHTDLRQRGILVIAIVGMAFATAAPVDAQQIRRDGQVWAPEVDELLERLERGQRIGTFVRRVFHDDYVDEGTGRRVPGAIDRYSLEERRRLLDGIERVATGEVAGGLAQAIGLLGRLARNPRLTAPEAREGQARLVRVYRTTSRPDARRFVMMELAYFVAEPGFSDEAVMGVFEDAVWGDSGIAEGALVDALLRACENGTEMLRRMHEEGVIRDHVVHARLRNLVADDFPREAMEEMRGTMPCPEG